MEKNTQFTHLTLKDFLKIYNLCYKTAAVSFANTQKLPSRFHYTVTNIWLTNLANFLIVHQIIVPYVSFILMIPLVDTRKSTSNLNNMLKVSFPNIQKAIVIILTICKCVLITVVFSDPTKVTDKYLVGHFG